MSPYNKSVPRRNIAYFRLIRVSPFFMIKLALLLLTKLVRYSLLNEVTLSGIVSSHATSLGIPIHPNFNVGSGPITVRPENSTRLPIKLFRICPSFPVIRSLIPLIGRPFVGCFAFPEELL